MADTPDTPRSPSGSREPAPARTSEPSAEPSAGPGGDAAPPPAASALTRAALEIDQYAAGLGWDQPARLFALVDNDRLRGADPELAGRLGLAEDAPAGYTPVLQDEVPTDRALDEFLATIAWPDAVDGCALAVERLMLPPGGDEQVPEGLDEDGLASWAASHPDRQELRITVAVLRDGEREAALRLRAKDSPMEVLTGRDLVPGLAAALVATFEE